MTSQSAYRFGVLFFWAGFLLLVVQAGFGGQGGHVNLAGGLGYLGGAAMAAGCILLWSYNSFPDEADVRRNLSKRRQEAEEAQKQLEEQVRRERQARERDLALVQRQEVERREDKERGERELDAFARVLQTTFSGEGKTTRASVEVKGKVNGVEITVKREYDSADEAKADAIRDAVKKVRELPDSRW